MTVAHKNITGTDLHEPKGVASANSGEVYIADGAASGAWTSLAAQIAGVTREVGEVIDYAGTSAPSGWLLSFGQAISRSTYSALYTVIGTTYGVGDGSTTFNLPDLRGRVVAGKDDMGATSANRLTDAYTGGLNGDTLGDTGGEEAHTQTLAELVAHTHTISGGINTGSTNIENGPHYPIATSGATDSAGGGDPFNVVQPTIILNKIIFTGV